MVDLSRERESLFLPQLSITGAAIWINPFVGILTIIALWPVAIMFMHLRTTLRSIKIIPKYAMYQVKPQVALRNNAEHWLRNVCVLSAAGAGPESTAECDHQHPGSERNHRLCSPLLCPSQRIQ